MTSLDLHPIVVWGAADLVQRGWLWRRLGVVVGSTVLVLLALVSARYVRLFRSDLELLQHAADVTTDNITAYNNLAVELHHLGRLDEAIGYFDRALQLDYMDYDARFNRARALMERGNLIEALTALDWLTRRHMERADFAAQRAEILAAMGRRDEAVQEYHRAIALDPKLVPARNNLALLLAEQGQLQAAANHLEHILRDRPGDLAVLANLANVYLLDGDYRRAAVAYARVFDAQPTHAEASYRLGALRAYQGRLQEAIALYRRSLSVVGTRPEVWVDLGSALLGTGEREQAREAFERALQVEPAFEPARQALEQLTPKSTPPATPPAP